MAIDSRKREKVRRSRPRARRVLRLRPALGSGLLAFRFGLLP
jgi:hypothetical protein